MLYADTVILPTNIDIPVGNPSVCVLFLVRGDEIAENDERVQIIVSPVNPLDVVNQNTTLLIMDNDGLYIKLTYTLNLHATFFYA